MSHPDPALESVPATARRYGLSGTSLYRWILQGDVPVRCYVRLGGRTHVRVRAFREWLEDGGEVPRLTPLRAVG